MLTGNRYYNNASDTWRQLFKVDDVCYLFEELASEELINESYTVSFAVAGQAWVFFHDYFPDFYFHTREKLYNLHANTLYRNNTKGDYGKFHDDANYGIVPIGKRGGGLFPGTPTETLTDPVGRTPGEPWEPVTPQTVYPFFIDVVFKAESDILLETVNWVSTVLDERADEHDIDSEWNTLTHITVWNSQQHTGRIALQDAFKELKQETHRKTRGVWSFNDFRNVIESRGVQFLQDLFNNYSLDESFAVNKTWYEKELLQDKYMIVRFEFDNSQQKQLILQDTTITATKQIR